MLPVGSQGCLALTCKTYYTQFKFVFRDKFFEPPSPWSEPLGSPNPNWELVTKYMTERETERCLFLTQTQTQYWRFCSSCRKLHPKNEFEEKALTAKDEKRYCKWHGIVMFSSQIIRFKLESDALCDIDRCLPWRYQRYLPEFGLDRTPWLALRLERDQDPCIIATSCYHLIVPRNFNANYPMICPHIALFNLFSRKVGDEGNEIFECRHYETLISGYTAIEATFLDGEELCNHWFEVRRKLDRSSLSGRDLWWRQAKYGFTIGTIP